VSRETKKRIAPVVEIAVLATLLVLANWIVAPGDAGFLGLQPHPILFLTLLVLARYGLAIGAVAAGVFAGETVLAVALFGHAPVLLTAELAAPLVVLVPTTVLFGMLVDRHLDRARKAASAERTSRDELQRISLELDKLRDTNVKLGEKILQSTSSAPLLFDQLKALATLDRAHLGAAALRVVVETLHADAAALWDAGDGTLRVRDWEGSPPGTLALTAALERRFERDVLAAHRVPPASRWRGMPLLVGRIRAGAGGAVVGYLTVDKLPLAASADAVRLFPLLVEWLSIATGNAIAVEESRAEGRTVKRAVR